MSLHEDIYSSKKTRANELFLESSRCSHSNEKGQSPQNLEAGLQKHLRIRGNFNYRLIRKSGYQLKAGQFEPKSRHG